MATDIDISHYNTGTATVAANGTAVTGQGTTWQGAVRAGDMFGTHKGDGIRILSVDSNTSLTLAYPWTGGAQTAAAYEIQRTPYDLGYQKAVEDFLEALQSGNLPVLASLLNIDNIVSLAEQVGESGTILGFSAPGVIKQIPLTSLILGELTRVDTLAERDAYDDELAGFTLFVLDADGAGRAALFWKLSDASGDWSDPAWYTGATGPASTIDVGTVTRVPFGQDPDVTSVPVPGGIELNFDIEEAPNLTFPPVVTVPADQDADAVVTPIAGGYSVQLSIPRGPAGDINGVTPFWQSRITADGDAAAARAGLEVTIPWPASAQQDSDFDAFTAPGWAPNLLRSTADGENPAAAPALNKYFYVHNAVYSSSGNLVQKAFPYAGGDVALAYRRLRHNNVWSPWVAEWNSGNLSLVSQSEAQAGVATVPRIWSAQRVAQAIAALAPEVPADVYKRSNILGPVSETDGVPTGAIIERGNNTNGEYVRFADGTQIAFREVVATDAGTVSPFAATFSTAPSVLANARTTASGALGGSYVVETRDITVSQAVVKVSGHTPTTIVTASIATSVVAIGRWF